MWSFLAQNWVWFAFPVLMVLMHRGHGGHGGHNQAPNDVRPVSSPNGHPLGPATRRRPGA